MRMRRVDPLTEKTRRDDVQQTSDLGLSAKNYAAKQAAQDAAERTHGQDDPLFFGTDQVKLMIAEAIEGLAGQIRETDVSAVADKATEVARRHPLLFVGGAIVAGFAAARFIQAPQPSPRPFPDQAEGAGDSIYTTKVAPNV